jgi:hypothetical protein
LASYQASVHAPADFLEKLAPEYSGLFETRHAGLVATVAARSAALGETDHPIIRFIRRKSDGDLGKDQRQRLSSRASSLLPGRTGVSRRGVSITPTISPSAFLPL